MSGSGAVDLKQQRYTRRPKKKKSQLDGSLKLQLPIVLTAFRVQQGVGMAVLDSTLRRARSDKSRGLFVENLKDRLTKLGKNTGVELLGRLFPTDADGIWMAEREERCLTGKRKTIYFHRPVKVSVKYVGRRVRVRIPELDVSMEGPSTAVVMNKVVAALLTETDQLHGRMTHTLSEQERQRKGKLLGLVDLGRSGLLASSSPTTRVFGRIEEGPDGLWFRALGSSTTRFSLPRKVLPKGAAAGQLGYAVLASGDAAEPVGPVKEFELVKPMADDELQKEMQHLMRSKG